MRSLLIAVFGIFVGTGCASKNDADVIQTTLYAGVDSIEGDPIVCKKLQVLNTRIKQTVCDRESAWRYREQEAQEFLRREARRMPRELILPPPTSESP